MERVVGLLQMIEGFLRDEQMTPTRFGRLVANDSHLVRDLRGGREPRPKTVARIEAFIRGAGR